MQILTRLEGGAFDLIRSCFALILFLQHDKAAHCAIAPINVKKREMIKIAAMIPAP